MDEILKLMKDYEKKHMNGSDIILIIYSDGSGHFEGGFDSHSLFSFNNIEELKKELAK